MVDLAYARTLSRHDKQRQTATARVVEPKVWINHACKTSPIYVMTALGKTEITTVNALKLAEDLLRSVRCRADEEWE